MEAPAQPAPEADIHRTTACVVGAGPCGVMLSLLLARAGVLAAPLRGGRVEERLLAEVQRRREGVTRTIQRFQTRVQGAVVKALKAGRTFRLPLPLRILMRIPLLRDLPPRITAFGVRRVRLEHPAEVAVSRSGT